MKKFLFAFAAALLLVACGKEKDNSALEERVGKLERQQQELLEMFSNLNSQVSGLAVTVRQWQEGGFVKKIERTLEGFTVFYADGTSVTLTLEGAKGDKGDTGETGPKGDKGDTPVISVQYFNDNLYWTVNGEFIVVNGSYVPVNVVPLFNIDANGHLIVTIGGQNQDLGVVVGAGGAGDALIRDIIPGEDEVVFILVNGDTFSIPMAKAFRLEIAKTTYDLIQEPLDIPFTVKNRTQETVVDVWNDANYKAKVDGSKITVTPPATPVEGSILAFADSRTGLTSIVKINFTEGGGPVEPETFELSSGIDYAVPAEGGTVEVAGISNVAFTVNPKADWISYKETRAEAFTVVLEVAPNTEAKLREGSVELLRASDQMVLATIKIAQAAAEIPQPTELKNIGEVLANIPETAISDATAVELEVNLEKPAVVSYMNGKNIYFEDETGAILIFMQGLQLEPGVTIKGKIKVKAYWYQGIPEIVSLTPMSELTYGRADVPCYEVTIAELLANYDKYFLRKCRINGITVTDAISGSDRNGEITQGTDKIAVYAKLNNLTLAEGNGDLVCIPALYVKDGATTKQVYFWQNDWFIAGQVPPQPTAPKNIAEIIAAIPESATGSSSAAEFDVDLENPVVVSYMIKDASNKWNIYVEDETAGILLYLADNPGIQPGVTLKGKFTVKAYRFNGLPEIVSLAYSEAPTFGQAAVPLTEVTISELLVNYDKYMLRKCKIAGVTVTDAIADGDRNGEIAQGEAKVAVYAQLNNQGLALEKDAQGDLVCIPGIYAKNGTTKQQVYFWQNDWFIASQVPPQPVAPKNIAEIIAAIPETATGSNTAAEFDVDLENPVVVSYMIKSGNNWNIYLEDETAGILLYLPENPGIQPGVTLKGKFTVKAYRYKGLPEIVSLAYTENPTFGQTTVPCTEVTISELLANYDKYMLRKCKIVGVTVTDAIADGDRNGEIAQGDAKIAVYAQLNNQGLVLNKDAQGDLVCIPGIFNTTKQVYFWQNDWFIPGQQDEGGSGVPDYDPITGFEW